MVFDRLEVENLFAYQRALFDLSPPPDGSGKSILLIHGRNGQGKTSLLNSLKLAFSGISDDLRNNAVAGRKLAPGPYLKGTGDGLWEGILNREVRKHTPSADFRVRVDGRLTGGERFSLVRTWRLKQNGDPEDVNGRLDLTIADRRLSGEKASDRLEQEFPPYAIPFFLFDGEVVQSMASDDGKARMEAVARLLDIEPIERLSGELGKLAKEWAREFEAAQGDDDLARVRADLERLRTERTVVEGRIKLVKQQLDYADREAERLMQRVRELERAGLRTERARLDATRREIVQRIDQDEQFLATTFPIEAPLLFAERAVQDSLQRLRELGGPEVTAGQAELLVKLQRNLPGNVLEMPPYPTPELTSGQIEHLHKRIVDVLGALQPASKRGSSMSTAQRTTSVSTLEAFATAGPKRETLLERLGRLCKDRIALVEITSQIEQFLELSEGEAVELDQARAELRERDLERGELRSRLEHAADMLPELSAQIREHEKLYKKLEAEAGRGRRFMLLAHASSDMSSFFAEVAIMVRRHRRADLERRINERFFEIFSSNQIIRRVSLDEQFQHRLIDKGHGVVGAGNISAGMKQLFAISFLWALKDASQRRLPVVIDTPLARLDREHQDLLLSRYFPVISHQVILLPTNSEIDINKYRKLLPYVYREYRLENPTGQQTEVREGASARLYALEGGAQ